MTQHTILATGAAGFIGYHVAEALLCAGHRVVGVDNFNDYYSPALKEARHARLEQHANYQGHRLDLCDLAGLQRVMQASRPDRVCHLAAQAGVRYSLTHPHAYQRSNLEGFFNVLHLSQELGVSRFVYASSSSVYGNVKELPFSEDQRVDTPISLYAATKKANELVAHTYSHLYRLPTVGLRFFTVYGPWGRPDMALWLFTRDILAGKPIPVFNHGDMRRDFTCIDDIVAGVLASLFAGGLETYEIFNLGNHQSEPLLDLIAVLEASLGKKAEKTLLPMQPGDVQATYANIERARAKLGFEPHTSIREGIPRFVEWYRSHPDLIAAVEAHSVARPPSAG